MSRRSAGEGPSGTVDSPVAARPRIAAELAEHLGRITTGISAVVGLLAEMALVTDEPKAALVADSPERMWKLRQVADAWGVSSDTVRDWVHAGELKTVQVGREYRVPDSECARFIRDQIRVAAALRPAA